MSDHKSERSKSVIETSLTELAFIFFFILLAFSTLKISEVNADSEKKAQEITQLAERNLALLDVVIPIQSGLKLSGVNPQPVTVPLTEDQLNEVFEGLDKTKEDIMTILSDYQQAESLLGDDNDSISDIVEKIADVRELAGANIDMTIDDAIAEIESRIENLQGQNSNLRNKLQAAGNGLVFPPCWANPDNGSIEYVYQITILEEGISVAASWPDNRIGEVSRRPHISAALGDYVLPSSFWTATAQLYRESVRDECRHFVTIVDRAESKDAFKRFLLTVERHFYKLLLQ